MRYYPSKEAVLDRICDLQLTVDKLTKIVTRPGSRFSGDERLQNEIRECLKEIEQLEELLDRPTGVKQ